MGVNLIRVADPNDERLADYVRLTDVALRTMMEPANGLYIAESAKVVGSALRAGHVPRSILMSEDWLERMAPMIAEVDALEQDAPLYVMDREVLSEVAGFHVHRGALASMQRPALPTVADVIANARRIVILEDIVNHTNVGAIFRSVAAIGADAVLITPQCADPLYRRSVRVSMGAVLDVPWTRLAQWPADLELLRESGFSLAALALSENSITMDDLTAAPPERLALVLGAEGDGIGAATLAAVDAVVRIPMAGGIDSLNVAAAAAVAMWALRPAE